MITGLLLQFNLSAQVLPVTLHVETAGTLPTLINPYQLFRITDLTLTGNLNGTDIRLIREMAGGHYNGGSITNGQSLTKLNLAGANIVSGGDYYYRFLFAQYVYIYPINDIFPAHLFSDCYERAPLREIFIPNSVTSIGNAAFKNHKNVSNIIIGNSVTSIEAAAFGGSSLNRITIPNSVTWIGYGAFMGCERLTEIHSYNPTPPSLEEHVFSSVNKMTCKLYVPKGSISAYRAELQWKDFYNIIEEGSTSAIVPIEKDNITIQSISNGIAIETQEQTPVSVYNLSGQTVYQSVINGNVEIRLNKGIYFVNVNNESKKIIVK